MIATTDRSPLWPMGGFRGREWCAAPGSEPSGLATGPGATHRHERWRLLQLPQVSGDDDRDCGAGAVVAAKVVEQHVEAGGEIVKGVNTVFI
jgi:hypothetical protein